EAERCMDPVSPNILYATMWRFDRKSWKFVSGNEEGGVFRSIDGGRTWTKLATGLPKMLGRSGVAVAGSNSNVVYVIAESKDSTLYRRSEEHTSELQSLTNLVCRLLLDKKKTHL